MIAATLFSGIGAPEQAMPAWHWHWHAEIDKFPAAVMAQRHPHSANLGDVTVHDFVTRAERIARPDILVFGSPCQSYSVAGKRLGLDDPRGNLALVALGIVARLEPRWFVFENVPGLLSSSEGRDFGLFLRAVDEIGYSLSWAVLDAQYFGVAQRRERVFAVGHLGDWRGPAAVLLEPESLCGNPPAREQAREGLAGAIGARTGRSVGAQDAQCGHMVSFASAGHGGYEQGVGTLRYCGDGAETLIAHALRADGFDASEDGTGRGTPIIAASVTADSRHAQIDQGRGTLIADTVRTHPRPGSNSVGLLAFDPRQIHHPANHSNPKLGDPCHPLRGVANAEPAIAFQGRSGVRRLMPSECEALQGFPRGYTAITYRGKPAADGPRYKALGNSMAVPVLAWILSRVEQVDAHAKRAAA